jgi:glycosyltransferase involved in cell wall biosynthesis
MKPLVSILIPAYNAQEWIADTIQSALGQTWPLKEIIVVDDGSTDRTLAIASRFSSKEVIVVTQSNQGASAARNKAFSLCHGDYIQWLDADDLLAPDKIARQMEAALQCPGKRTLFSSAWGSFYYRPAKARFVPSALWESLSPIAWLLLKFARALYMPPATWLVSREVTKAAGPWDTRISLDDDGEYFCRVIAASNGIQFIPEARTYYRKAGSDSMSHIGQSDKKLESLLLSMQLHVSHIRALEDSEKVRSACLNYLQSWSICYLPARPDLAKHVEQLALALGGRLRPPRLWGKKWMRMQKILGLRLAKQCQNLLPLLKETLIRSWDKALFHLQKNESVSHAKKLPGDIRLG